MSAPIFTNNSLQWRHTCQRLSPQLYVTIFSTIQFAVSGRVQLPEGGIDWHPPEIPQQTRATMYTWQDTDETHMDFSCKQ